MARSNFDISHRFVGTFIYELPYGKGRHFGNKGGWVNAAAGGWDLTFSQTLQSGPPMNVTFAGAPSTPYAAGQPYAWLPMQQRPNQILPNDQAITQGWTIGPNRLPTSLQNPYLNAAAFAYPAPFTPGTLGRNTLEAPGLMWAQVSISKTWALKERVKFQARWDFNNPFTRFNFSEPNRTYNAATLPAFGRMTGTRGSFGDIGGRPHSILVGRVEW